MIDLARITGGQYYSSMINHEVINDDIGAFIDHYYVLGFYLKEKLDGRFQSLKANVKRKKCRVIFQKGFYNPKPYEKLSDFEKKLHLNDLAFNEIFVYQDPIPLNMTAFPFEKDGKQFLMVMTEIPENRPKSLFDNKSELFVFLSAGNNTVTQVNLGRVDLADLLGTNTYFYIVLPLPPEEYQCRSVIRNTVTGEAAVASAITTIPDQGDLGMTVSDTLLFFADRECRVVQFHTDKKEKIATDEKERLNTVPILTDVIPFLPQNFKLIDEELNSSENEFCAFLKIRYPINEKPVFHLNLELQNDSSGVLLPIDYQLKQTVKKNNVYDVLIEVVIPSVKPGPYSLIFNIKEEKSGKQIKISRTIKINEGIR